MDVHPEPAEMSPLSALLGDPLTYLKVEQNDA
jgi:hypothetical protein